MNGILYSPFSCLSASILRTSTVFIDEFHAMLAMKISRVSMGYGSPRHAFVMTLCIRPCTASGYSHEKALSMRTGPPASSMNRSPGAAGQPSGPEGSGVFGLTSFGLLGGFAEGGTARGYGDLWRKPPGR